jgi:predicted Fe-Mo cluster-binding NifX family protein
MIVAIPTHGYKGLNDRLFGHFGKAPTFTIADLVTGGLTVIDNTSDHMGGLGSPPELIKTTGADAVVVGHLGEKAVLRCAELGITVLCGANGTVSEVLGQLKDGKLGPPCRETMCKHDH